MTLMTNPRLTMLAEFFTSWGAKCGSHPVAEILLANKFVVVKFVVIIFEFVRFVKFKLVIVVFTPIKF